MIKVLDKLTIDQIAAGEVVERPLSVVKELVENSIDALSDAITVEIKNGGKTMIRVTDNGSGIEKDDVKKAFLAHATSKIIDASDLLNISSLGFRGEALSSISAVSKVEMITRTHESIVGNRYIIEGGNEIGLTEIGAPEGTTIIVRDIFYNTPARLKFLGSDRTEAGRIEECMLHFSLSHPNIRFQFISDGKPKLKTTNDASLRTSIYYNYGKELIKSLLPIDESFDDMHLSGYIAKPEFSRGNKAYMNYYVNGRHITDATISAAIMDGYRDYLMNHRFPFTALMLDIPPEKIDVNVHPTKKEVRFKNKDDVYRLFYETVKNALDNVTLIPDERLPEQKTAGVVGSVPTAASTQNTSAMTGFETVEPPYNHPDSQPHDQSYIDDAHEQVSPASAYAPRKTAGVTGFGTIGLSQETAGATESTSADLPQETAGATGSAAAVAPEKRPPEPFETERQKTHYVQERMDDDSIPDVNINEVNIFKDEALNTFNIIGQIFDTYWLVEYSDKLLIIDQHAAHEKVLYERFVKKMKNKEGMSQRLISPIVVTLSGRERDVLYANRDAFLTLGYEWESFGDSEILIQSVPADFLDLDPKEILLDVLGSLMEKMPGKKPEMILDHIATMSCKAAIKGGNNISEREAKTLIADMLSLDEPYHCPHGRPTTISMSKYEFEKKFKRII
ncbi:MAG: DNA mismatch repair endonuclease MutL [Eubacterium sp.]|nr:DNA mismatch repair endonuclease MutL [Eubacterium sp.]